MHIPLCAYLDSLSDFITYAESLPISPDNESVEVYHPRYTKLHASITGRTERSFLSKLGFKRNKLIDEFKNIVYQATRQRELEGAYGDFVKKYYIESETRWFVWGALHGAFHSLIAALEELKKQNMLDNDLKIIDRNVYFVFNGNIINYGPYQIETLLLILKLVEKNPKHIVLIKGQYEEGKQWMLTNLIDELKDRISSKKELVFITKQITSLFNTFTLALYLVSPEFDVVRISFFKEHPLLKEDRWGAFFLKKADELRKLKYITDVPLTAKLKSFIGTHRVEEVPSKIQNLVYKMEDTGHYWTLFSSPIKLFQVYYDFHKDSLLGLKTGRYFSDWVLTLYSRSGANDSFKRAQEFDVATGRELFTADSEKRVEDLTDQIELAEIRQKELQKWCEEKRASQKNTDTTKAVQK